MANALEKLSFNLAENLVILRKKRSLSQLALARLSQVPRSTITYLESGMGNPSLKNLSRIASALQVRLEELLSPPRNECKLIKSKDVAALKRANGRAHLYKLLPDPLPGMEIDRLEIKANGQVGGIPHVEGTKEYLTVTEGRVRVRVAGQTFVMSDGDVLAFPGDQAHSYENTGTKTAICFSVVVIAQLA